MRNAEGSRMAAWTGISPDTRSGVSSVVVNSMIPATFMQASLGLSDSTLSIGYSNANPLDAWECRYSMMTVIQWQLTVGKNSRAVHVPVAGSARAVACRDE